jgi:hypothetical protein
MTKQLTIDILAKDKTKQALTGVRKNLNSVKNSVFSLKGALVGLGAGAIIKSFVDVGKEVESLQVRFKFLFGSIEEGKVAFDSLTDFAGRVPFSLEEISRASGNLAVVAKDAQDLNRVLEITGNVAAVTGLDFETTSSQIQRAFSGGIGAADLFRERGVRALLGFQAGAKVTAEETIARFEELFSGNGQFANATKDLATTLEGTISMIGDKYFKFQKDVASGFFDELKGEFGDLNEFLEQNEQQIKDIATSIGENFAGAITTTSQLLKDVAPTVKTIADNLVKTVDGFNSLPPFVKETGLIAALFLGKKGYAALAGVSFLIGEMKEVMEDAQGFTGIIDVNEIKNVNELSEKLKVLTEQRDALIQMGAPLIGDEATMDEEARQLQTILTNIENVTQRIRVLNALNIQTGDAYAYSSTQAQTLIENLQFGTKHAEAFGNAYMTSILLTEKETIKAKEKVDDLSSSFELASKQASAFGGAYIDAINKGNKEIDDAVENKFPNFTKAMEYAQDTTAQLDDIFTNTFNNFADTLADALMSGKANFKDFARSVIRDIARMIARQQALLFYQRAFGFLGGSIFGIPLPTPPARSSGGRVNAGMPYMVGEAGKEMFIPQTSGTIVPNNQLAGAGTTNINFTINTVDAQGVDELLTNRRSTIINVINDALNRQGKEALV